MFQSYIIFCILVVVVPFTNKIKYVSMKSEGKEGATGRSTDAKVSSMWVRAHSHRAAAGCFPRGVALSGRCACPMLFSTARSSLL